MLLTKKFSLKVNSTQAIILGHLTMAASKLFNVGNYERKEYRELGFDKEPNWYDQKKRLKDNLWYKSLPSQTAQDVLAGLEEAWKSYKTLKYKFEKGKKLNGEPKAPYFKAPSAHTNVTYLNNSFKLVGNKIRFMIPKLLKTFLKEKFNIEQDYFFIKIKKPINGIIKEITFSYINKFEYIVLINYDTYTKPIKKDNGRHISIDLGLTNLATIYDNKGYSFIISGNSFLSTLHWYNKRISHYQSIFDALNKGGDKHKTSKRINELYQKKNKTINYIIHTLTRRIVDYCLDNHITRVIIGDIKGIDKKESSLFGQNKTCFNQKMHSLPYDKIYSLLDYKLKLKGIVMIKQEESFSSQCSPLCEIVNQENASKEKRVQRGLFKDGKYVFNADSVGAFNILRKYYQENKIKKSLIYKCLSNPRKISISVTSNQKEVGVKGRNCPDIMAAIAAFNSMLGNSIAE